MHEAPTIEERAARNRHAREVIAGLDVTPGMHQHPAADRPHSTSAGGRATLPRFDDPRTIYGICLIALFVIGTAVALVAGFMPASVVFFVASLVMLAGFFVF